MLFATAILVATLSTTPTCPPPSYSYCVTGCESLGEYTAHIAATWGDVGNLLLTLRADERATALVVQPRDRSVPLLVIYRERLDAGENLGNPVRAEVTHWGGEIGENQPGVRTLGVWATPDATRPLIRVQYAPCGWEQAVP